MGIQETVFDNGLPRPDWTGLTFVDGIPREAIELQLKGKGLRYFLHENKPGEGMNPFFRSCSIHLDDKIDTGLDGTQAPLLQELFGYPGWFSSGSYYYYARYEMGPAFDRSQLHGKLTFNQGLLVERTHIYFHG